MTTKVIIRSPKNNHQAVAVHTIQKNSSGKEEVVGKTDIPDGEERSFYVHSTQDLRIIEVPKKQP